jgi:hypothetical protein
MGGTCGTYGAGEVHIGFCGNPEGRRTLSRSRLRWEDNIKMDNLLIDQHMHNYHKIN